MKILVTGGCGFIGSHMVDRLLNDGHDVVVLDNCSTGRLENLEHQKENTQLTVHVCDIADYEIIEPYFKGVDRVFHIAALADIVPSIQEPLKYHRSNVDGTINVLEASRIHEIKHLIYAASSSCYGIPEVYPTPESTPIDPQYPYALTKYLGEEYVMHYHKIYQLPVTSMRFFNVYGPRSRTSGTYGAVFGVFLAQKLANKPYTIVGDGTQTRDYTYVTDVVDACVSASENEKSIGEIFNVGSNNHYSVNRLVELLGGEKIHIPKRPGEPDCTFADTTKIKDVIGWSPSVSFEKGVQNMIDNIDYWREAPVWDSNSIKDATKDWFKYLK
ncbi:MAG: NAD-dependent dehydratase [Verrucomicrobia bacterium]|nr:NAD-dependent dehydratase [Verrucomicrobiota bacterium]